MHMYLFKWLKVDLIIIKKQYIFLQMINDVFCLSIFLEGSAEFLQDTWSTSGLWLSFSLTIFKMSCTLTEIFSNLKWRE